jgi:hypothetical protein
MRAELRLDGPIARLRRLGQQLDAQPGLARRVRLLQAWQAARLSRTYADLRAVARLAPAVEFFLSDLYGPHDFAERNRQLVRASNFLQRALPAPAFAILAASLELEALTVELDQAMAAELSDADIDAAAYAAAYRAVGRPDARQRQIELLLDIGRRLDRIARRSWIGLALRAAHAPAHLAGLGVLQDFLERGFAAFHRMRHAGALLLAVEVRERALLQALFSAGAAAPELLEPSARSAS